MSKPRKHGNKWRIRWVDEKGMRQSEVYTEYKDAVFALKSRSTDAEEVRRGFKVRPPKDRPFSELVDRWLKVRTSQKRSEREDVSILRAHLTPAFGAFTLKQITSERIAVLAAELGAKRAPQTTKNVLTLLGAMLRQAVEWGWTDTVPKIRKPKLRMFAADYRWLRTNEDIDRFLAAAKEEDAPAVYPLYATAIFTGMRAGELAGLRWADVDFPRRLITVQRSFNGPTKAGDIRHVPILDRLLPVLKEWRLACGSKLVFPNGAGEMWGKRGRAFCSFFQRSLVRAGFDARYVHFHGLRHTFASHWVLRGGDLFRLQKILGHKSAQMTQRYAHLSPAAFESDWGRFGAPDEKKGAVYDIQKAKD